MKKKKFFDFCLLFLVMILAMVGLLLLYSTSTYNGQVKFADPSYYLRKQMFATALGFMVLYVISQMDYHALVKLALPVYLLSLVLGVAVLLFGDEYNGSRRWLSVGPISFQPSEFAKVAVILFLTQRIVRSTGEMTGLWFMGRMLASILPAAALIGINNLSTAVIILGIGVVLIFVANPCYRQFVWIGAAGVALVSIFLGMESYRLERLAVWRNPEKYEKGFQTIQGLFAIGSGGIFGRGLGSSLQKLGFVPEAQNDMIFSIICEETGLCGALLLMGMFVLLIWRMMVIAVHAPDLTGALIGAGIMAHMAIQVILNIGVVTNTIPNTGITLPFVSYGGTSVLFLLGEMGLALSVSRWER